MTDEEFTKRCVLMVQAAFGVTPGPVELEIAELMRGVPANELIEIGAAFEAVVVAARKSLAESKTKEPE